MRIDDAIQLFIGSVEEERRVLRKYKLINTKRLNAILKSGAWKVVARRKYAVW